MISLIITAFGKDQPGLISSLSGIVNQCDGNIRQSRMLRMGNEFVMVIFISLSNKKRELLEKKIKQNTNFVIFLHETAEYEQTKTKLVRSLVLKGADNEGIVHSLTKFLARMRVNIYSLESHLSNAPMSGTPLFNDVRASNAN